MVIGSENVIYGIIMPISVLLNLSDENCTNSGIRTVCTGIIIPIIKYVSTSLLSFQRIFAMANAAIAPKIMEKRSVIVHTINELRVAVPKCPIVHAKL